MLFFNDIIRNLDYWLLIGSLINIPFFTLILLDIIKIPLNRTDKLILIMESTYNLSFVNFDLSLEEFGILELLKEADFKLFGDIHL